MASQGAKMLLALLALMITGSLQKDASGPWKNLHLDITVDEGADALFTCTTSDPEMANVSLVRTGKGAVPPDAMSFNYTKGITLYKVRPDQRGEYVCEGVIGGVKEESDPFELLVREIIDPPTVTLDHQGHVRIVGEEFQITCRAESFAPISVTWNHNSTHANIIKRRESIGKMWIYTFTLKIPRVETADSGNYTCKAQNWCGTSFKRTILQVLDRGYLNLTILENRDQRMTLESDLKLQVLIESYPKLLQWRWTHQSTEEVDKSDLGNLQDLGNERYKSTLTLYRPKPTEAGIYTFFAANSEANSFITFALHNLYSVAASMYPLSEPKELQCQASGYPEPDISWYWCPGRNGSCEEKEMLPLEGASTNVSFGQSYSTLRLKEISQTTTYVCNASNVVGFQLDFITTPFADRIINREVPNKLFSPVLATFGGVAALFLLLLILLFYKYKQKPKYETRWQIIEACEGNNYIFIDPTQLPYNEKLEFPRSNLTFGKTLGAGAFGKVLEATAHGLGKEDSSVKVAVKMLKQSAHTEEKEALMSELKIMSHLGQHNNIVNLLGACTHGGPILVITEYCQHGDLLNFLRKKGESFVIKAPATEMLTEGNVIYKNLCVDKKYTRSDSGFSSQCRESYVEMRPVRSDSTSKGSVSAEGDDEEDTRPLMLQDLLHFSGQVAQGMAFLASKNCIHRDVAARNVLVTHGRVAKICDFGLARDIMNDSNYVVKGNARLPVKWMAPESIFDCIYTMQSDVWSYGILLWEIFSLGMSPYPGILVDGKFYKLVKQGYHMAQPDFAPLEIYEIMKACWDLEPTRRPTFQHISDFIQHLIGSSHDQNTNLPCNAAPDEDSGCDLSSCDKGSCEQGEAGQPLMKGNNYQFC